jgi:Tol biopolymer transport system component
MNVPPHVLVDQEFKLTVTATDDQGVKAIELLRPNGERLREECEEFDDGLFRFAAECSVRFNLFEIVPNLYAYRVFAYDEQDNQFMDFIDVNVEDRALLLIESVDYNGNELRENGHAYVVEADTDAVLTVRYENIGETVNIIGDTAIEIDGFEIEDEPFAALGASRGSDNIEIHLPDLVPGLHRLSVVMKGEGTNNIGYTAEKIYNILVEQPGPEPEPEPERGDLEITEVTVTQNGVQHIDGDPFIQGKPVIVEDLGFVNHGPGNIAGRVRFGFSLINEAGRAVQEGGTTRAILVDAGDDDVVRLGGPFTFNNLEIGRYTVEITMDSDNAVAEVNEENNTFTFEFDVVEPEVEPEAEPTGDLEITQIDMRSDHPAFRHEPFAVNSEIQIRSVEFINHGPENIAADIAFSFRILNEQGRLVIPEESINHAIALDADDEDDFRLRNAEYAFVMNQPGTYTLEANIDADNDVLEHNENNNVYTHEFVVVAQENACQVWTEESLRRIGQMNQDIYDLSRELSDAQMDLRNAEANNDLNEINRLNELIDNLEDDLDELKNDDLDDEHEDFEDIFESCGLAPDLVISDVRIVTLQPLLVGLDEVELEVDFTNQGNHAFYGPYGMEVWYERLFGGHQDLTTYLTLAGPDVAFEAGRTSTVPISISWNEMLNNADVYPINLAVDECVVCSGHLTNNIDNNIPESNENNNRNGIDIEIVDPNANCEEDIDAQRRAIGEARNEANNAFWHHKNNDSALRAAQARGDQNEVDRLQGIVDAAENALEETTEALSAENQELAEVQNQCDIHENPDLVITDVQFIPANVVLGQEYIFEIEVENIGDAPLYGNTITLEAWQPDGVQPRTGFNLGTYVRTNNNVLEAGDSITYSMNTESRYNYFNGENTYAFNAAVDQCHQFCDNPITNSIVESNENNNVFDAEVTVVNDGVDVTLENYPRYLINVEDEQTYLVVGEDSPASDSLASIDIGSRLVSDICNGLDNEVCVANAQDELILSKFDNEIFGFGSENQIMIGDVCENKIFGERDPGLENECERDPVQARADFYEDYGVVDGTALIVIFPRMHRSTVHIGITGPDVQCRREATKVLANYEDHEDILQGTEAIVDCRVEELPEPFDLSVIEIPNANQDDLVVGGSVVVDNAALILDGQVHGRLCHRYATSFNPHDGNNGHGGGQTQCEDDERWIANTQFGPYDVEFNAPGTYTFTFEAWVEDGDGNRLIEINEDNNEVTKSWVVEEPVEPEEPGYYHVVYQSTFWAEHLFDIRDGSFTAIVAAVNNTPRALTWHPDGDEFAYTWARANEAVYKARLDENHEVPNNAVEVVTQGLHIYNELQWSPDGTKIAFSANIGDFDNSDYRLFTMDVDGGNVIEVTANIEGLQNMHGPFYDPAWSPDSSLLTFTPEILADDGVNIDWEIFVVQPDGQGLRRLTNRLHATKRYPSFTADSQHVVYLSHWPNTTLYKVDIHGENDERLFGEQGYDSIAGLEVSPDGEHIAFVARRVNQNIYGLYLVDQEGGQPVYINDVASGQIAWSPDSSQIAILVTNPDNERRNAPALMDLEGNIQIISNDPNQSYYNPVWRPKLIV